MFIIHITIGTGIFLLAIPNCVNKYLEITRAFILRVKICTARYHNIYTVLKQTSKQKAVWSSNKFVFIFTRPPYGVEW